MFPNDQTKLEDSTTPHSADTTPAGERVRPFLFQLVGHVGPAYAARPEDFAGIAHFLLREFLFHLYCIGRVMEVAT